MVWLLIFIDQLLSLSRRITLVLVVPNTQRLDLDMATDGQMADLESCIIHTQKHLASVIWGIPSFVY